MQPIQFNSGTPPSPSNNASQPAVSRRYSGLTPKQQNLLRKFQIIGYGTVENLFFQDGDPVDKPAPKTRRNIRLRGFGLKKPQDPLGDFELKDEHIEFFTFLEEERSGYIAKIEVRDGLPAEMSVEEVD